VLFTSFLDFDDGRKNWLDLVSAFTNAHRDNPDATLFLKLSESGTDWMQVLYKRLAQQPRFACRVLVWRGMLDDTDYTPLIAASNWYVSASKAEALPLPLIDFLAAGRPAIAPIHTALSALLDADNALIVASEEEPWSWPVEAHDTEVGWSWTQHPDDVGLTTRHRVSWSSLVTAYREAHRLSASAPQTYASLSAAGRKILTTFTVEAAAAAVEELLSRNDARASNPAASPLQGEFAAE
jgi:hypothetical protein